MRLEDVVGPGLSAEETEMAGGHLVARLAPEHRAQALAQAKESGFTFYNFCAGVDWPDEGRFDVLDQVYDWERALRLTFKFPIPRDEPVIETGTTVYAGSNWYERETAELFGIVFKGHPGLTRLFLPDWQEGFPLRKDYLLPARVEKPWPGDFFEG